MAAPVITGLVDVTFEQSPLVSGDVLDTDANATATDAEQNYDTGTLTISGMATGDTILFGGNPGEILEGGGSLSYLGTEFATWSLVGADVVVVFDADANDAAVTALLRAIQLQNAGSPVTVLRTLTLTLVDGAAESASVAVDVQVIGDANVNNLLGTAAADTINGFDNSDTLDGGDNDDRLYGGNGGDTLIGGAGNDTLNGGAGGDGMTGGADNDLYVVDDFGDFINEVSGEGVDTVNLININNYSLPNEVENLLITGTAAINAFGNSLGNTMTGNGGVNQLQGQDGADTLNGMGGNDNLQGGNDNDTLNGSAGNDTLDGGTGADTMNGGAGNDEYVVDDSGDVVDETGGSGIDHVTTSATITLGAGIENASIVSNSNINLTGNALNNVIDGGANNNIINGEGGRDTITGFDGDDELHGGDGNDILYGGNANDVVYGEAGNDQMYSGAGTDTMYGGIGNDSYYINDPSQTIVELAGEGIDTTYSTIDWTLSDNVDNLVLNGSAANGTGNAINNTITGNASNNNLNGGGGVDTLNGGDGADVLTGGDDNDHMYGGTGADRFVVLDSDMILSGQVQFDSARDFNLGEGDQIDLSLVDADINTGGDQAFTIITTAFTKTAGEAWVTYDAGNNRTSIRLDVDGDGRADYHLNVWGGDFTAQAAAWIL